MNNYWYALLSFWLISCNLATIFASGAVSNASSFSLGDLANRTKSASSSSSSMHSLPAEEDNIVTKITDIKGCRSIVSGSVRIDHDTLTRRALTTELNILDHLVLLILEYDLPRSLLYALRYYPCPDTRQDTTSYPLLKHSASFHKRLMKETSTNTAIGNLGTFTNGTVAVIDPITKTQIADIQVVGGNAQLMIVEGNDLYVLNKNSNGGSVINTITHTKIEYTHIEGSHQRCATYGLEVQVGKYLYVVNCDLNNVAVTDTVSQSTIKNISVGQRPIFIIFVDPYIYVLNSMPSKPMTDNVSVIDTVSQSKITDISIPGHSPSSAALVEGNLVVACATDLFMIHVDRFKSFMKQPKISKK